MSKYQKQFPHLVLVGHPFAPIGVGENTRSALKAFKTTNILTSLYDVYRMYQPWPEFTDSLTDELSQEINIFFINGDEVEPVFNHLQPKLQYSAYNIVFPFWELNIYPKVWAQKLEIFDEIWTASTFTYNSIKRCVSKPVNYIPCACQVEISSFLGRQYFGIPEGSFAFLFAFDFLSSIHRKNPFAVLQAFQKLFKSCPNDDICLVLKLNNSFNKPEDYADLMEIANNFNDHLIIIDKTLSNNEMKNLLRCSDCFISLHRSEGFGLGLSEAMSLGKPTIATRYGGNVDFMNESNSCLVDYKLEPVGDNCYPHWQGQYWAEADVDQAFCYMLELLRDRHKRKRIGDNAKIQTRKQLSYASIGQLYENRIFEVMESKIH